ncbi:EVE domain-containing protein [Clostridium sp.]|uniref:EVE domain-containing protein n=1 Tax=Clostridium sp. TaxID=1506 RepID=UPI002FC6AA73
MKTWILQSNPKKCNIYQELFESDEIQWSISRYKQEISIGDKVFIWIAEGDRPGYGGIVAKGEITGVKIVDINKPTHGSTTVKIKELRLKEEEGALLRTKLKTIKELENLSILKSPNNAIFKLSDTEAEVIEDIWCSKKLGSVIYEKKIININSTINVTRTMENYCISKLSYLNCKELDEVISDVRKVCSPYLNDDWLWQTHECANYWENAHIYLVNEELMDHIHHPCSNLSIDENYFKDLLPELKETKELNEDRINGVWERIKDGRKSTHAMGVYFSHLSIDKLNKIKEEFNLNIENRDVIFICPERVYKWCDNNEVTFPIAFAMVVIHELAHFYINYKKRVQGIDTDYYGEPWGKVIEESIANVLAYNRFSENERAVLRKLIGKQPIEYRACIFWILLSEKEAVRTAVHWAHVNSNEICESIKNICKIKLPQNYTCDNAFWKAIAIKVCISVFS